MKIKRIIFTISLFLLITGCGSETAMEISTKSMEASEPEGVPTEQENTIVVYICGAVKSPGVYALKETSRIIDLIEKAGGATETADLSRINLAQKLVDGQQVIVAEVGTSSSSEKDDLAAESNGKVNLNFADKEELMTLPGIGEAKAQAILDYRMEIGWFQSPEEIMNIGGIKDKMYERIAGLLEV